MRLTMKAFACLKENGIRYTWHKIMRTFKKKKMERNLAHIIEYTEE